MKTSKIGLGCLALLAFIWAPPLYAQELAPHLKRLQSPFAAEREGGVQRLIQLAPPTSNILDALGASSPRVRLSLARVVGGIGKANDCESILRVCQTEADRLIREELEVALMTIACREGCELPEGSSSDAATARFLTAELKRLEDAGVGWSDDRELGRLLWTGHGGVRFLTRFLADEEQSSNQRGLAAIILGRLVGPSDWVGAKGPSSAFLKLLASGDERLKSALFYAAAAAGVSAPEFLSWVANHAVDRAMGPLVIEACLYFLYTRDDKALKSAGHSVVRCALEYTDGYPESIHYNAAVLLKRVAKPDSVRQRLGQLRESAVFGNYFLFDAILKGLSTGGEETALERERLVQWGLKHAMPQIRAAAFLDWSGSHDGKDPVGVDRSVLLEALSDSISKVRSREEDADCYAQRGGVASLAALGGKRAESVLRHLLKHSNEAVRMAAAMAIGDHGLMALKPTLEERLSEEGEFAVFGAAYALKLLGGAAGKAGFIRILRSGNWVLMRPSLVNLRSMEGGARAPGVPSTQLVWRQRAVIWERR